METRISRSHASSSSISRSRSPISDNGKRSISTSPRRGPSTPIKSSIKSDDEQDPNDRETLTFNENSKTIMNETSSPMMSDTEENQQKKRSRHRRHHHHHKQSKSNKRSITHHKHPVKRSKKEPVSTINRPKSDEDNSISSPVSENEQSPSEQEIISSDNQSNDEEGIVEGDSTPNERRSHRHRKKQRRSSSSTKERNNSSPQSSSINIPKNNKGTQLIVNYLPASLRESDFYQLFARIAPIKLCKLITDRHTGHSFCYGFIEYHNKEDAVKAIEKFNGYRIEHKKLKVSYAQPKSTNTNDEDIDMNSKHMNSSSTQKNSNIYITDLPDDFDEKMLERLFSKYGEISQTKILRDPRTRISRGVAFVLMASTRYAERAVKALDGYIPSGTNTPISVKYADPKKTASENNDNNNSSSRLARTSSMVTSIGSYGYPPALPPMNMIDPYYVAALHHHRVAMNMRDLSPSPPPSSSYYPSGRSSRLRGPSPGLLRSYSSSSSSKHSSNILTTTMNNSSSRSSNQNSSLPTNLNNSTSLAAACDLISKGCQQAIDPNGFVIYAFGLPHDCNENDLEELFRRYGDVYRVYIVRNYSTGESKGYAFVTMRNYDEACHAVDRLDGSTFQGRTIQVRFKQ